METTPKNPQKISQFFEKDFYETYSWQKNEFVAGIDEVGRGCTAGPLVAAAAILKPNSTHPLLKDSKELDHKQLLQAYQWIMCNSWHAIGICNHRLIDTINIYQATQQVMSRALAQLYAITPFAPARILVDAVPLHTETFDAQVLYFTKGESKSSSIAAASIIAKVTRDRIMDHLNTVFPRYQINNHKGYHTKSHQRALALYGTTLIHRKSFIHESSKNDKQTTLFC